MSILLLPDIIIGLATVTAILAIANLTARHALVHLDRLRAIAYQGLMDAVTVFRSWQQSQIDHDRQRYLSDFEERILTGIGPAEAREMLEAHRREMRQLK